MSYRRRLRETPTPDEMLALYPEPHDARLYGHGHYLRVEVTKVWARWMAIDLAVTSAADLSTGNAEIPDALPPSVVETHLGDFAAGYQYRGPIEETIIQVPPVDLFICSETIEHVDDPEAVLLAIRSKARLLLLSTPIGENDTGNPEHLWGWDQEAVAEMLHATGWRTLGQVDLILPGTYSYQIHAMEAAR